MRFSILLLCCFLLSFASEAQLSRFRAAKRQFENKNYTDASLNIQAYLENNPSTDNIPEALRLLGESYKNQGKFENAEPIFRQLFDQFPVEISQGDRLSFAQILAENKKFKESEEMFSLYNKEQQKDLEGRKYTITYQDDSSFYKDSSSYRVSYLGAINSKNSDFSPVFYENGLAFVSARKEPGLLKRIFTQFDEPFLDLFLLPDTSSLNKASENNIQASSLSSSDSDSSPNEFEEDITENDPSLIEFSKKINTKYHEGPFVFFNDQKRIVFTRNNVNPKPNKNASGLRNLKLYMSTLDGKKWKNIVELPFNSDDFSCGHPALNLENDILYFASDMPGGYGGTDIYKISYKNELWGQPENLGPLVNTEGNELFPYIDQNGNLYFSSNGQHGLGGLDLFYIHLVNDIPKGELENLGAPFNSKDDDFGILTKDADRTAGFFSSNRKKRPEDDNIYAFVRTCSPYPILVLDAKTNKPLSDVTLNEFASSQVQKNFVTNENGRINLCLNRNLNYNLILSRKEFKTKNIDIVGSEISSNGDVVIYLEQETRAKIEGLVYSEQNKSAIQNAKITLKNLNSGEESTAISDANGNYTIYLDKDEYYELIAIHSSYQENHLLLGKLREKKIINGTYKQDIGLYKTGDIVKLENIYYDFDKWNLRRDAKRSVNEDLLSVLKKYPEMKIEIRSHTDSYGERRYNKTLSEKRAQTVLKYLVSKGIEPSRLSANGYGEEQLLNNCSDGVPCSSAQHQENRRTEFKIISFN